MKELMQQYTRALRKIDQDSQLAERQVIQEFPHDPDAPGIDRVVINGVMTICALLTERLAKLKEVEDNAKEKKEKLKTKLTFTVQLLADAYDRYTTFMIQK